MKKASKEIITAIILSVIFILLSLLVLNNKTVTLDNNIHSFIISIRNVFLNNIFKTITTLGSATVLTVITLTLFLLFKNKVIVKHLAMHLTMGFLLNQITKIIFLRPRPSINIIDISGYSYPSGHSMMSLIFYGYLAYIVYKSNLNKTKKLIINTFLITLIILIGLSRIYLGVHYTTDVIGGFILATIYLLIIKNIKEKKWFLWKL